MATFSFPPIDPDSLRRPAGDRALWPVDPAVDFLNHGSFGNCPLPVLDKQREFRDRLERQPCRFLVTELVELLDGARASLAEFLGAKAENLVFVTNATSGVNTVLRSLVFEPGDELLVTNHEYNACRNALEYVARNYGARVVVADLPFPCHSSAGMSEAVLARVTGRTRLALLDHVTSQTALVMPIAEIVRELSARGVDTLVDGAHAPGMLPLNLQQIGAAYYTGNCHKWICAPKSVAFLHVRPDRQKLIRPLSISHGANSPRTDRSRFQIEFEWTGTVDPTPALSVPEAIRVLATQLPGGWPSVMARNHALALAGRKALCAALEIELPCPEDLIGSMASIPITDSPPDAPPQTQIYRDPLQARLIDHYHIEVPVIPWPASPRRLLRVAAQLYNSLPQYERLAEVLKKELR